MRSNYLPDCDVVIIGAGPAGCEMAYRMASARFDVLVAEKDVLDREKPCGGGIQLIELQEFGPLPEKVIERRIRRCRIISPENRVLETDLSRSGQFTVTVKRSVYDRYLQERAARAGAKFLAEVKATEIHRQGQIVTIYLRTGDGPKAVRTRLVVNAAGSTASNLNRMFGIRDKGGEICVTYHHWLKPQIIRSNLEDAIEFYYLKENPEGYVWIFPKKDVISIGIGATAVSIKRNRIHLKNLLENFILNHPLASKKLANSRIVRTGGGIIRFGMLPRLCGPSAIVLGDAAGLANMVHGGGIYHARKSALIASKHCQGFLRTGNQQSLNHYDEEARDFFENYEMRWDRKIRRIFWNPRTVELVVAKAKEDKKIREAIRIVLNSTQSHEEAYRILEQKMLEIIYFQLDRQSSPYKDIINKRLREVFKKITPLHTYANEILLNNKAKRLRACLGILASEIFNGNRRDAVNAALVHEVFHAASLIHDDIMDEAEKRRGKKTLHVKYGLAPAIITGDLMMARCYSLISQGAISGSISKGQLLEFLQIVGDIGEACCLGQLLDIQMAERKQYGSIKKYLKMIELKTGSLIEGAVKAGPVGAGASPEQLEIIGRFGRYLGAAFQIIDDSVDLLGGPGTNKSVMNDLRQGKATSMLIHTLKRANRDEKRRIMRAVGNRQVASEMAKEIVDLYRKYNAIAYAQELSLRYVEKARMELTRLPPGQARERFDEILDVLRIWGMLGKA